MRLKAILNSAQKFGTTIRVGWALLLLQLLSASVLAQDISISPSERLSSNLQSWQVVGKNSTGVLIYKNSRDKEAIEVYDDNMELRRRKTLDMVDRTAESVKIVTVGDDLLHFYTYRIKRVSYLMAQRLNAKLLNVGKAVLVDSINHKADDHYSEFMIRVSEDHSHILLFRLDYKMGDIENIYSTVMGPQLNTFWKGEYPVPKPEKGMELFKVIIGNEGQVFYGFRRLDGKINSDLYPNFSIHSSTDGNAHFTRMEYRDDDYLFNDIEMSWDNMNHRMVLAGFYAERMRSSAEGYFYFALDLPSGEILTKTFYEFSDEFISQVLGKAGKNKEQIPLFELSDLLLRSDGGAVLIAEYVNMTSEAFEYTDFDPYFGGYRTSTRYVDYFEYSDVIVLMTDAKGQLTFDDVMRKRQVSREDEGKNSSYCMVNTQNRLYFIFNEEISADTNVMGYTLYRQGFLDRESLLNSGNAEVMLMPRRGKQVSANEIVIPSIYKNSLSFVKLSF